MKKTIAALITFMMLGSYQSVRASETSEKKLTITNETAQLLQVVFDSAKMTHKQHVEIMRVQFPLKNTAKPQLLIFGVNVMTIMDESGEQLFSFDTKESPNLTADFTTISTFIVSQSVLSLMQEEDENKTPKESNSLPLEDGCSYKVTMNNGELLLEKVE